MILIKFTIMEHDIYVPWKYVEDHTTEEIQQYVIQQVEKLEKKKLNQKTEVSE